MSEQRLKVESGPPQHMISDEDAGAPPSQDAEGATQQVKEKAREVAGPAKEKAREVAGPAREKAQAVAGQAKGHAQAAAGEAKARAAVRVDEKSTQVGVQIGSQGEALEGVAGELRRQGKEGQAQVAEQAAEKVKGVGEYLQQADGDKLVETAQQVARDNPAAAAAVGAAAGFAAGRVIKASREDGGEDGEQAAPPDPGQPGSGGS